MSWKGWKINMDKTSNAIDILKAYNQDHIINLLNKLEGDKKEELIDQINSINFQQMKELYENTKKEIEIKENKIEAIPYIDKSKLSDDKKEELDEIGTKSIKNGEYAVVTMAGGQGTRLRTFRPKRHI